jgi:biopolymer transport protein ExbB
MKKTLMILLLILPVICLADRRSKKQDGPTQEQLLQTIETLKQQYAAEQAKLQNITEDRWSAKQKRVSLKENNKEEVEQIQQQIEHLYSDVARAREEFFARDNALEKEKEVLQQKQLERDFLAQAVQAKIEKESEINLASFPVDQDARMAKIDQVANAFPGKGYMSQKLNALLDYKLAMLDKSSKIGVMRRTFITDVGESVTAQVLRIGYSMAYAMTPDNDIYYCANTGKLGKNQFEWRKVNLPEMTEHLVQVFPGWIESKSLSGKFPIDILQNNYSSTMVGGEQQTWKSKLFEFLKAGGPIILILAFILLWALILIFNRIYVYTIKHRRGTRFIKETVSLLSKNEIDKAKALAQKSKGIHARILDTCLKHRQWKRSSIEKEIREQLLSEVPQLEKYLNTIAVFAAASPLLGLLGTVTGMIRMFEAITKFGTGDPKLLAGGISEALITTEVGLILAIPLLLIHNFLRNRRNRIQASMEMNAMVILNRLWPEE